jgi:hypothetical protein
MATAVPALKDYARLIQDLLDNDADCLQSDRWMDLMWAAKLNKVALSCDLSYPEKYAGMDVRARRSYFFLLHPLAMIESTPDTGKLTTINTSHIHEVVDRAVTCKPFPFSEIAADVKIHLLGLNDSDLFEIYEAAIVYFLQIVKRTIKRAKINHWCNLSPICMTLDSKILRLAVDMAKTELGQLRLVLPALGLCRVEDESTSCMELYKGLFSCASTVAVAYSLLDDQDKQSLIDRLQVRVDRDLEGKKCSCLEDDADLEVCTCTTPSPDFTTTMGAICDFVLRSIRHV